MLRGSKFITVLSIILIPILLVSCGGESNQSETNLVEESSSPTITKIVIDGDSSDWIDRPLLHEDAVGDQESSFLDISSVYSFANTEFLYVLIELDNPGSEFSQLDFEITADNQKQLFSWEKTQRNVGVAGESDFAIDRAIEGKIDLRDLGSPEANIVISQIRVMAGDATDPEDWRAVDEINPPLQYIEWVNEIEAEQVPAVADQPETDPTPEEESQPPVTQVPVVKVNFTTSGSIQEDEIWREEIHLTGDIEFTNGATLTIEPGTKVFFAPNSDDRQANDTDGCFGPITCGYDDPTVAVGYGANTITIDGRGGVINAQGTAENPIIFLPEGDNPSSGQFGGILIESGKFQYTKILRGSGMQVAGAPGPIEISYNEIRGCTITCIGVHKDDVWVHHNILEDGGHQTIGVMSNNVLIEHNTVYYGTIGISLEGADSIGMQNGIVRNNLMIDCGTGIAVHGQNIEVVNNTIAYVNGPPEWNYYQGEKLYPVRNSWLGAKAIIVGGADTTLILLNNIISGEYTDGVLLPGSLGDGSLIDHNLFWGVDYMMNDTQLPAIGETNIEADPMFVDLLSEDLRLGESSPAIDSGFNELLDPDGSISDIGAYGGPNAE